jgi:hypothetical protein
MTAVSPSFVTESASSTIDPGAQARRTNDGEPSAGFQSALTIDQDAVDGLLTAEEFAVEFDEDLDDGKLYTKYRRLVAEQAALRRLATLVARGVEPLEVFGAHRPFPLGRRGYRSHRPHPQHPTPQDPRLAHPLRSIQRPPTLTSASRCCHHRLNPPSTPRSGSPNASPGAGISASVGSVGDSFDNALAATINGLYETEVIKHRGPWRTVDQVEYTTAEWVDWFNHRRLYEYCGGHPASRIGGQPHHPVGSSETK